MDHTPGESGVGDADQRRREVLGPPVELLVPPQRPLPPLRRGGVGEVELDHLLDLLDQRPSRARDELLRISEESFRTAFEDAPVRAAVSSVSPDGSRTIILANPALATIFRTTVAELIGSSLEHSSFPEDRAHEAALFRDLAAGRRRSFPLRKRRRRADGSVVWIEARVSAFALPGVQGPLALGYLVDVSDLMAHQRRLGRECARNECVSQVATAALAEEPFPRVLQTIVQGAASLLDGDGAFLTLEPPGSDRIRVEARHGELLAPLAPGTDLAPGVRPGQVADEPVVLAEPHDWLPSSLAPECGPMVTTRFPHLDGEAGGHLAVVRRAGAEVFTTDDADELARLVDQTRVALQLSWTRTSQQRLPCSSNGSESPGTSTTR